MPQTGRIVCRLLVWCCIFFFKGEKNLACVPLPRGNWFHMTTLVPTSAGRRLKWLPHAPLKCLKGEAKRKKQERRGKTKLSQPQDISTAQCLLGSLYFIPFCTSQTFSEILQRSAACECLDWMRTTIFGRQAHFRWNMGNICALNAGFCRAYIYIRYTNTCSTFIKCFHSWCSIAFEMQYGRSRTTTKQGIVVILYTLKYTNTKQAL